MSLYFLIIKEVVYTNKMGEINVARKIDKMKEEMIGEVLSQTELENYMSQYDFTPLEIEEPAEEKEGVIKFTNYRSQIWVECEKDDENNILILNLKKIAKLYNESTRVEPFRKYEDLNKVLDYFKDNELYHHWFTSCLMVSLGRRVGDTMTLKWLDLFLASGEYRERLTTLKEEKTGKVVGVKLNALAKHYIDEYCEMTGIDPMEHYKEEIFSCTDAAFRKALKQAVKAIGLTYPISTHSFRKFYANTIYKLHPQDADNLMIVQTMMGHSNLEITKIYINEIDRKVDKYNIDYAEHMINKINGIDDIISNSPVISIRAENFREILSECYDMAQNGEDKFDVVNKIIGKVEKHLL